jgi:micrococcal nuclease
MWGLSMDKAFPQLCITLLMLLFLLIITYPATSFSQTATVDGFVSRVWDGNNLTVETRDRKKLNVRLYGIDAPELDKINRKSRRITKPGQPFGIEAKSHLSSMVFGQDVRLEIIDSDRDRRLVSIVWVGEKNINLEMIKVGMAEAYVESMTDQTYRDQFLQAEKEAKSKRLGIWSQGILYERPSDYRKKQ